MHFGRLSASATRFHSSIKSSGSTDLRGGGLAKINSRTSSGPSVLFLGEPLWEIPSSPSDSIGWSMVFTGGVSIDSDPMVLDPIIFFRRV